jgi:large subunit ribosomal protein L29
VKFQELENKTVSELYQKAIDLKKEMLNLRIQAKTSQLTNPARIRECRRDFARIQTKLKQLKSA